MNTHHETSLIFGATSDGVQQALGREPKDFRDFVRDAAAAGAWQA